MLVSIGDVVDGVLVNAIALAGRRISVAVDGLRGRRLADDLTAARWFETYQLTSEIPDFPAVSPEAADRFAGILRSDEVQAALQELLAARLTDAPEMDAAAARQVLVLTLSAAGTDLAEAVEALVSHYDDQVCALVARLEADDPPLLAQVRSEAFSARMINILNAIERHTAALSTRPAQRTENSFLIRYRRHVVDQHGKLEPPDFDRRRRVPIANIYVPTGITEDPSPGRGPIRPSAKDSSLNVFDLAERLDRSVLLGDPGGGKTTTANVLMHHFALNADSRVPFLVTLRDYAAKDPPEHSVTGHIEHTLKTFYQCPAPPGLVDLLMLTGRAVVIFDGLDELLDTSRRTDVSTRIERFCAEYPLAPVLVTSRMVGYDRARLDDGEFTCYRLGGFDDTKAAEYARLWFVQDAGARPGDAEAFLTESDSVRDLRSNPLLLSLMCILYRGEGSLPRDRAGVYEKCADLLFRRWDARRRIHQELRAGHLLEPALRHLAWWLWTRASTQAAVTERELIDATTEFLHGRGFEYGDDARAAACEFVEFCRGRMWVFSDAGTTVTGESLYAFTHRTFLEYFAAAQIAYASDSPEQLADTLVSRGASNESLVVAELAVQIKDRTSNGGAPRIYRFILDSELGRSVNFLRFLALCLRSVDPSPRYVRELTRRFFEQTCNADREQRRSLPWEWHQAWKELLENCGPYRDTVASELDTLAAASARSGNRSATVHGLRLAFSLPPNLDREEIWRFWRSRVDLNMRTHHEASVACAEIDAYIRLRALKNGLITTRQALDMPDGPSILFQDADGCFAEHPCYFADVLNALEVGWPAFGAPAIVSDLAALGDYLTTHRQPPWLHGGLGTWDYDDKRSVEPAPLSEAAYLGAAVSLLIIEEFSPSPLTTKQKLGPLSDLAPYTACRRGEGAALPELPVPDDFKQTFRDWADGRVNFASPG